MGNAITMMSPANWPTSFVPVPVYRCPAAQYQFNQFPLDGISWGDGVNTSNWGNAFTTHYYGVQGPTRINPTTGVAYQMMPGNYSPSHWSGGQASQGVIGLDRYTRVLQITDGTSNTLILGEQSWAGVEANKDFLYRVWSWGYYDGGGSDAMSTTICCRNVDNGLNSTPGLSPDPSAPSSYGTSTSNYNNTSFGSDHPGAMTNFALADGSVRSFNQTISLGVYMSLASYNGNEPVSPPD